MRAPALLVLLALAAATFATAEAAHDDEDRTRPIELAPRNEASAPVLVLLGALAGAALALLARAAR